jgi:hypothetical protein
MPDDIILRFSVKDDGSPVIERVNKKIGETKKETQALVPGLEKARQNLTGFVGANTALIGVLVGVGVAMNKVIQDHIKYANEVRQLSALSGETTENTSRFIQVLDDYKLGADDALLATRALTKNGLVPNIETLAKLSDQYLSINDVEKKNEFILKNLGKGGAAWTEVLNKGSKALLAQGEAIDKSLILTQKMVDDARKAEIATDNWNDAIGGLKTQLAVGLLPALTGTIKQLNAVFQADKQMTEEGLVPGTKAWADRRMQLIEEAKAQADSSEALMLSTGAMKENTESAEENAKALKEITEINQSMLGLIGDLQGAEENYQSTAADLIEERKQIEMDRAEEVARGWAMDVEKVAEYDQALAENSAKVSENKDMFQKANAEILSGLVERKLMQDGVLDDKEFAWLVAKRIAWGIYSEETAAKAREAWAEADHITASIANIPENKTTTVDLVTNHISVYSGGYGSGNYIPGYAAGGVSGGGMAWVGERGPELVNLPSGSRVHSAQDSKQMAQGGTSIDYKKMGKEIVNALRAVGG